MTVIELNFPITLGAIQRWWGVLYHMTNCAAARTTRCETMQKRPQTLLTAAVWWQCLYLCFGRTVFRCVFRGGGEGGWNIPSVHPIPPFFFSLFPIPFPLLLLCIPLFLFLTLLIVLFSLLLLYSILLLILVLRWFLLLLLLLLPNTEDYPPPLFVLTKNSQQPALLLLILPTTPQQPALFQTHFIISCPRPWVGRHTQRMRQ